MFNEGIGGVGRGSIPEKPLVTPVEQPEKAGDKPDSDPSETPPKPIESDTVEISNQEPDSSQPEIVPNKEPEQKTPTTGQNIDIEI